MSLSKATLDITPSNVMDRAPLGRQVWTNDDREPIPFFGRFSEHRKSDTSVVSPARTFSNLPNSSIDSKQKVLDEKCTLKAPPKDGHSISSDIAFGDGDGTSGFVNENGELISIVQMLDMGPSGLFRVRPNYVLTGPDYVPKSESEHPFDGIVRGNRSGMGLNLVKDELLGSGSHQIDFIHDRWPRISSRYDKLDLEVQLAIKEKCVIQHYTLRSRNRINVKFAFNAAITIDDLHMVPDAMKGTFTVNGGTFTVGATAISLAGGAGGHVRFLASLFKDAQPVALDLSSEKANFLYDDPFSDEYFTTFITTTDLDNSKWASNLSQEYEIEILEGQTRTMTAIYQLECKTWNRDEVYSMHLMPKDLAGYDEIKQRRKEEKFMEEYVKVKANGDNDQAKSLFNQGIEKDPAEDSKEKGKKDTEQHGNQQSDEIAPFSNWGGEVLPSHRLFGLEWRPQEDESQRPPLAYLSAFDAAFSDIRKQISQAHGKMGTDGTTNFTCALILFQVPHFIDVQDYLVSSCCGHWNTSLGDEKSNFLFRRHLQHLLFVTAIPVPWDRNEKTAYFFSDGRCVKTDKDSDNSL